jgi:glycosyltransferase involved in cell wall biosynthesis
MFRIAYIARSFLDYRVPVFVALDELADGGLHVVYSRDVTPERVSGKIEQFLGTRSIGLVGERRIGPKIISNSANSSVRIVYQPRLFQAINDISPDIVLGDGFFQWTSFGLIRRIFYGTPLVICYERTFHTERHAQWYRTLYRRKVLRWVDAMACNGSMSMDYAQWLGMPAKRITSGQMVADTSGLQRASQSVTGDQRRKLRNRWGDPEIVFLAVGRLVLLKGFRELLLGWEQFERSMSRKASLIVVGDGPERSQLLAQVQSAGLRSVFFEGAVDYDQIAPFYRAADAFIIPTLEDNWSLVVPEAMACGLPILCSKYNGCWPELVREGNGWVFDPLDSRDILRVLDSCAEKASDLPRMGQQSREIVAAHTPRHAARSIYEACLIAVSGVSRNSLSSRIGHLQAY